MSSQEPPLPYVGAISLKNLQKNTQFQSASNSELKLLEFEEKKAEDDDINIKAMSARSSVVFGSSLWDASNIIPYTDINDFKVELLDNEDFWNELNTIGDVARLDEFLSGANMSPVRSESTLENSQSPKPAQYPIQSTTSVSSNSPTLANALAASPGSPASSRDSGSSSVAKEVFYDKYSTDALVLASVPGEGLFNPGKRRFHTDELKPQPVIKKSRKTFVPDGQKDDRYWARRVKNNTAAKRSRDAKRIKENQIALRAGFLEEENDCLKKELAKYKSENKTLRKRIEKYEPL